MLIVAVIAGGLAFLFFGKRTFLDSLQSEVTIRPRGWYAFAQVQLSYWLYLGARYD